VFQKREQMMTANNLLKLMGALVLFTTCIMLALAAIQNKISATRGSPSADEDSGCVDGTLNLFLNLAGAFAALTFVYLSVLLRNCTDGFGLKSELGFSSLAVVVCLGIGVAFTRSPPESSVTGTVTTTGGGGGFEGQPWASDLLAISLISMSTLYPLFRSYYRPPERSDVPEVVNSVVKLLSFPLGFESFKAHLRSEFSVENVLFWKAVCSFQTSCLQSIEDVNGTLVPVWSPQQVYKEANDIYEEYIKSGSAYQVNVPHRFVKTIKATLDAFKDQKIQEIDDTLFNLARQEVLELMQNDSYPRYRDSGKWMAVVKPRKHKIEGEDKEAMKV
jgi:hypothetical protein